MQRQTMPLSRMVLCRTGIVGAMPIRQPSPYLQRHFHVSRKLLSQESNSNNKKQGSYASKEQPDTAQHHWTILGPHLSKRLST